MKEFDKKITQNARNLRQRETAVEKLLWSRLRGRQFNNLKFKRQFAIKFQYDGRDRVLFADFFCHDQKLIIELDGSSHETKREQDILRDEVCENMGYQVLRFKNNEVSENIDKVLEEIAETVC